MLRDTDSFAKTLASTIKANQFFGNTVAALISEQWHLQAVIYE